MQRNFLLLTIVLLMCFSLMLPGSLTNAQGTGSTARRSRGQSIQQPGDRGWPRGYSLPSEAQIVIFQPQVATWDDQKHMVALAAVSYVPKGEQKPTLGTIKIEADTSVSLEQRLVKFATLKITETNFQALTKDQTRE